MNEDNEKHSEYDWKLVDERTGKVVLEGKTIIPPIAYERKDGTPIYQSGCQAGEEEEEE